MKNKNSRHDQHFDGNFLFFDAILDIEISLKSS